MHQAKLAFILIASLAINLTSLQAQSTTADEKTTSYLKKFRSDIIKSVLDNNTDAIQTYFSKDARLMPVFHKTVMGRDNIIIYYKAFAAHFDTKSYKRTETEILDLGPLIVEHGTFVMRIQSKRDNKEHELKGKYQDIWEEGPNGTLSLITEGWNFDHALEIAQQLRFKNSVPVVDIALEAHLPINTNISFELAALNHLMESAISQHDAKLWSLFYSDDAVLFPLGDPTVQGRKELDAYFEKHTRERPIFEKLDIRNDRIDNLGTYVIEYASHTALWRSGVRSGSNLGKDLRIWKRGEDGSLKIFRHMGMYD
jgi:ketosteroid isomerase-like protein